MGISAGIFLLAPACVTVLTAGAGPRVPVAVRIALRDLVRQRARSGAAVAAVSFAVFLAMLIGIVASVRFSNVLDYTGQNLTSDQLIMYTQDQGPNAGPGGGGLTPSQTAALQAKVDGFAASLQAQYVLPLDTVNATLQQKRPAEQQLLRHAVGGHPGAAGRLRHQAQPGRPRRRHRVHAPRPGQRPGHAAHLRRPGEPAGHPERRGQPEDRQVAALPSGTSAPNTVITATRSSSTSCRPRWTAGSSRRPSAAGCWPGGSRRSWPGSPWSEPGGACARDRG